VLLIVLNAPPSLDRWRLTGQHRLSPTMFGLSQQGELQQI
jgi:hypothetical protein